jgi:hypothetical protein
MHMRAKTAPSKVYVYIASTIADGGGGGRFGGRRVMLANSTNAHLRVTIEQYKYSLRLSVCYVF